MPYKVNKAHTNDHSAYNDPGQGLLCADPLAECYMYMCFTIDEYKCIGTYNNLWWFFFVSFFVFSFFSQVSVFATDSSGNASKFCTAGVDGRLVIWTCKVINLLWLL